MFLKGKDMRRSVLFSFILCASILVGCNNHSSASVSPSTTYSFTITKSEENESIKETDSTKSTEETLSSSKKMEIFTYVTSRVDLLLDTKMSDEKREAKAEEIWLEAEEKYNLTEIELAMIIGDTDLMKEYYKK